MSESLTQLALRLRRPQASLSGLDALSDAQLTQLHELIDAASERERQRVQSQLRRGIFWPLRWLLQRRHIARDASLRTSKRSLANSRRSRK
tara:strand:+ start:10107 stop:10379 length:273 start_codon:yes stop_codon:yes gene_type:complete